MTVVLSTHFLIPICQQYSSQYPSVYVPETFFQANPVVALPSAPLCSQVVGGAEPPVHVEHFGQLMHVRTPPVTPAAFLAVSVRLDFARKMKTNYLACLLSLPPNREIADALRFTGPTVEDFIEARSASVKPWTESPHQPTINHSSRLTFEMPSEQHDAGWSRLMIRSNKLSELPFASRCSAFVPGQLAGLWAGKLLVSQIDFSSLLNSVVLANYAMCPSTWVARDARPQSPLFGRKWVRALNYHKNDSSIQAYALRSDFACRLRLDRASIHRY